MDTLVAVAIARHGAGLDSEDQYRAVAKWADNNPDDPRVKWLEDYYLQVESDLPWGEYASSDPEIVLSRICEAVAQSFSELLVDKLEEVREDAIDEADSYGIDPDDDFEDLNAQDYGKPEHLKKLTEVCMLNEIPVAG